LRNISLKSTKKKLTVIFTLLVFAIAVLLEWVFFTVKYYNYTYNEKNAFDSLTSKVWSRFVSLNQFVVTYDIWNKLFRMGQWDSMNMWKLKREDIVNLLIIDRVKKELVFSNVVDDLSIKFVEDAFNDSTYWMINQKNGYLVKKIFVKENNIDYDVLFVKYLRYNFWDYLTDLLGFVFITLLFSILFYYIWLKFVSENLKPVEDNLRDMQDFIHNAWHELKTPISVIHSNLQLIKTTKVFEEDLVNEWLEEINRLNDLIESLVELSNISSSEKIEKINVETEIKEIINDFKVKSEEKNINIKFEIQGKKVLSANKQYFYILFSNLIWNAIKYSEQWSEIEIVLKKDKLIVKDAWIWISKENLDKIFARFFIIEKCRNTDWHWIWLSLVKKIADIYKWRVNVKSEEWKWSTFTIEF